MKFSSSEQTSGQKTHYLNQMPRKCTWYNSIPVNENFPTILKKTPGRSYLKTFIVLVSFFLTAKAESARARKAYSRRPDSGDGAKKCEQKKELGAVGPANRMELVEESYAATLPIHKPTKFVMHYNQILVGKKIR